jgi:hypothetical protein
VSFDGSFLSKFCNAPSQKSSRSPNLSTCQHLVLDTCKKEYKYTSKVDLRTFNKEIAFMSDSYSWWRQALLGQFGPIHESDPQPGYYRIRKGRGGPWLPVAIWAEDEESKPVCLVDGVESDPFEVWTWVCRYPVPYETYVAVAERGEPWPEDLPDLKKVRAPSVKQDPSLLPGQSVSGFSSSLSPNPAPPAPCPSSNLPYLGHNSAGMNEVEVFFEEIEALAQSCDEWLLGVPEICSQVLADKAANYAERFGNLENRAEEARSGSRLSQKLQRPRLNSRS